MGTHFIRLVTVRFCTVPVTFIGWLGEKSGVSHTSSCGGVTPPQPCVAYAAGMGGRVSVNVHVVLVGTFMLAVLLATPFVVMVTLVGVALGEQLAVMG